MNIDAAFVGVWSGSTLFAKVPKGGQVWFICCKFTKDPVLWQTVLTLNRQTVLWPLDLDLHCWEGVAPSHKKYCVTLINHVAQWRESALWEKRSYYHVRFYCFVGIKFNCTDSANRLPIVSFIKVKHWDDMTACLSHYLFSLKITQ